MSRLGQLGDGAHLANEAWELPSLRIHYEHFLRDTADLTTTAVNPEQAVVELARLVHRWRQFPFVDPDLPTRLLPSDWPGPEAGEPVQSATKQALGPGDQLVDDHREPIQRPLKTGFRFSRNANAPSF